MNPIQFDNSYANLPDAFHSRGKVKGAPAPELIRVNDALCTEMGLDAEWLRSEDGLAMLSGNGFPETADPLAMAYAGHQFGGFSAQLGDGRALLLGEVLDADGERWDVQLKGSGRTRFSRGGDGKATVAAIVREYLMSEGLFALGVPTTRALAAVTTGENIWRDEGSLPAAILCRVARSHVRVGTFEFFAARRDTESVRCLADYIIERHYPQAQGLGDERYEALLSGIIQRQASLVAKWMQVGFIHGVMNTDNIQIYGETLDYGPCAFMDDFRPGCVFSAIDSGGRYAWDQQPAMAHWGLIRLVESLAPLLADSREKLQEVAERASATFTKRFEGDFLAGFRRKFGLLTPLEEDREFVQSALNILSQNDVDFTLFFRQLTRVAAGQSSDSLESFFNSQPDAQAWLMTWQARIKQDAAGMEERVNTMRAINPIFIPRNHRVEEAIQAALEGDFKPFHKLAEILAKPFREQPENAAYEKAPTDEEKVRSTHCNT